MPDRECEICGSCCRPFHVYASAADAEREPRIREAALRLEPPYSTPERTYQLCPIPPDERCPFLDAEGRCGIHASRPDVCRDFQAGNDQCREARRMRNLPPLASGPLLP